MYLLPFLTAQGIIDQKLAATIEREAGGAEATPATFEKTLEGHGITPGAVLKAKADYYQLPARELGEDTVPFDILRYVPEESARYYRLAPLSLQEGALEIGITDPDNLEARDALNFITAKAGMPYKLFLITESDFEKLLEQYKGLSGEVGQALSELDTELVVGKKEAERTRAAIEEERVTETGTAAISEDAPVTKIVATIVRHAAESNASDIHIEPLVDKTRVRFRVDGDLATNLTLPPKVHNSVVARIKVLSNMRLDEKRKPQDGRFSARVNGTKVDFRVSTFPTYYGEKVVMRILGVQVKDWQIDKLGFTARDLQLIRTAISKPYGLVLISGPTGSGKSTTLYSILSEVDKEGKNVLSLEDPVEYTIPGVSQSQVRPEIGYTFANGLRTTLRQDPDIIMVGEIRDKETAGLAVQAALTGHLVLSTIHTNNSVGIIPRLLDMGVDPYLIPPTLILGMAQRLVRTLCKGGGERVKVEGSLAEMLDKEFADLPADLRKKGVPKLDEVSRLKPTNDCPSGTAGRTAVFEVFGMNSELERAILEGKPEDELFAVVRKTGMLTMKEDAIIKSAAGLVPFEEVNTLGGDFELEDLEVPEPGEAVPEISDDAESAKPALKPVRTLSEKGPEEV